MSAQDLINDAAARELGAGFSWVLRRELERLKTELHDSERLRLLAVAGAPVAGGLLAITDTRLIYLRKRLGLPIMRFVQFPLSAIEAVRVEKNPTDVLTVSIVTHESRCLELNLTRDAKNRESVISALRAHG